MWTLEPTDEYARRFRKYEKDKKRRRELAAVLHNLDRYVAALNAGVKPLQLLGAGFVHDERQGVVAMGEEGGGKGLAATRLYVYPDTESQVLHLLSLGDKNTQAEDVKTCHRFVAQLRAREAKENGPEETV